MPWTGSNDAGSSSYTPAQRARVVAALRAQHLGRPNATTMNDLSNALHIQGRALRQIISDADGIDFLLATTDDDAIFLAETYDDAVRFTTKLRHQAERMTARVRRRETFAADLPRGQLTLGV